jgi:hypothetical protein
MPPRNRIPACRPIRRGRRRRQAHRGKAEAPTRKIIRHQARARRRVTAATPRRRKPCRARTGRRRRIQVHRLRRPRVPPPAKPNGRKCAERKQHQCGNAAAGDKRQHRRPVGRSRPGFIWPSQIGRAKRSIIKTIVHRQEKPGRRFERRHDGSNNKHGQCGHSADRSRHCGCDAGRFGSGQRRCRNLHGHRRREWRPG